MKSAEIELKFPIADLNGLQAQFPALGFQLDTPRTFEQNTLYDTPGRTLRASKQILRVRSYGGIWTVTHKRPAGTAAVAEEIVAPAPRYKIRIETETTVEDGPALGEIFEQLGYAPVFRMARPIVLTILDGWGYRAETHGNAIALARKPVYDGCCATIPTPCCAPASTSSACPTARWATPRSAT
jgi:hypothetical protein